MAKAPPPAKHLTASMRVIRAHQHRPALVVADAQEAVKELALRLARKAATPDDLVLKEKLRKATGISVSELARYAEEWPSSRPHQGHAKTISYLTRPFTAQAHCPPGSQAAWSM
jgi:hypothetical protein